MKSKNSMDPLISIQLVARREVYHPGDKLLFDVQIDAIDPEEIVAVESSVMWYTDGKGDEDIGVHFFERLTPLDVEKNDLRPWRQLATVLPNSPLSYAGEIIKIRWCVRVRLFVQKGKEFYEQALFRLAAVPPVAHSTK
jgi:hypothetical protein